MAIASIARKSLQDVREDACHVRIALGDPGDSVKLIPTGGKGAHEKRDMSIFECVGSQAARGRHIVQNITSSGNRLMANAYRKDGWFITSMGLKMTIAQRIWWRCTATITTLMLVKPCGLTSVVSMHWNKSCVRYSN